MTCRRFYRAAKAFCQAAHSKQEDREMIRKKTLLLQKPRASSPTITTDGPSHMVKRPTGSGGEPSSPNCESSAGVKVRQLPSPPKLTPNAFADDAAC